MNKIFIFIIGIICGIVLSRFTGEHSSASQDPDITESADVVVPAQESEATPPATIEQPKSEGSTMNSNSVIPQPAGDETSDTQELRPHPVNFFFNEEALETMEQNIVTLQKEVSVIKDQDGWIVRFHSPNNLMSQIGLSDNDLILFNQLDEMRLNPDTQDLAMRMESVLANLER